VELGCGEVESIGLQDVLANLLGSCFLAFLSVSTFDTECYSSCLSKMLHLLTPNPQNKITPGQPLEFEVLVGTQVP
jgi:hypothetical protein